MLGISLYAANLSFGPAFLRCQVVFDSDAEHRGIGPNLKSIQPE